MLCPVNFISEKERGREGGRRKRYKVEVVVGVCSLDNSTLLQLVIGSAV